jgi:hypothetical protein
VYKVHCRLKDKNNTPIIIVGGFDGTRNLPHIASYFGPCKKAMKTETGQDLNPRNI